MSLKKRLIWYSINHPKKVILAYVLLTLAFAAALPSMQTDTDPVKMLDADNPAVVLYNQMKDDFRFNDVIVVGIHQTEGKSLFTVEALARIHQMTLEITRISPQPPKETIGWKILRKLQWLKRNRDTEPASKRIIVREDIISPSTVDNILLTPAGELAVRPLMKSPPDTEEGAQAILETIRTNLILKGKLASDDGSLVGIFIPVEKGMKDQSYTIGERIREITRKYEKPGESYYLAGLPIAETTFGIEMFIQMAVYAPLAGLLIFMLMFLFFKNLRLIAGPMILAMMSVLWAMGGLVYSGNIVHIMSSMIPIFLMPIALLDSIHIISHLHDKIGDFELKEDAVWYVMSFLFNPMLFTSITTMVGFMSLSITGIQPVQVFGITVGCGVFAAWFLSMTFVPAFIMLINFDKAQKGSIKAAPTSISSRIVQVFYTLSLRYSGRLAVLGLLVFLLSLAGILRIVVNDNPVRWFKTKHEIRRADRVMNHQLAGTYMTNLVIEFPSSPETQIKSPEPAESSIEDDLFEDEDTDTEATDRQQPDLRDFGIISYMEEIQTFLLSVRNEDGEPIVGAATSIVDILRKVGSTAFNDSTIPQQRDKIAQYMFLFESGDIKRGKDLWKYITLDFQKAQIWLQLKDGDNKTIEYLMERLATFMSQENHPPPEVRLISGDRGELDIKWTGLTHINNVWQDEMVKGMGYALLGSFAVVFLMMTFLFRSVLWGLISMIPLSFSIVLIYGLIGWTGKPYDMPIAVLSSLALGLSVDFAIHFNQSFREIIQQTKNIAQAFIEVFAEPARAIWRNVLVLAIGFLPLLFSELVPYVTVGVFFFIIMIVSGIASLVLLPSLIYLLRGRLPGVREFVV